MDTTVSSGVMFMLATSHDGRLLLVTLRLLPLMGDPFLAPLVLLHWVHVPLLLVADGA